MQSLRLLLFILLAIPFFVKAQLLTIEQLEELPAVTSIEEGLKNPDRVIKLELKKQDLNEIPEEIYLFKNLQWLSLKKNELTIIPKKLSQLNNLQVLDLSRNQIDTLFPEIGEFQNLKKLILNNNQIVALPKELGKLKKVEYLDFWNNPLEVFPKELGNLTALKEIDLRDILFNDEDHKYLFTIMPKAKIHFSHSCNCH